MKTVKTLLLERKDLCPLHLERKKEKVSTSNFRYYLMEKINKAEIVIFEGIILKTHY